jgi:cell division protein FtsA
MGRRDIVSAIDIGTTKVVAVIAEKSEGGIYRILGLGSAPSSGVKRGLVVHIDETVAALKLAVEQAEEAAGIRMVEVYVGIASQHIRSMKNRNSKYLTNEEITQADVDYLNDQMARTPLDPGEEIIHVIPQDYVVDSETVVTRPAGMSGRVLEANFHLVISKVTAIRNITKCIERLNLKVKKLILEPLASSAAVLTEDEKEAGVVLLDIGGGTTDIAVFHENVVRYTAVIPFGGNVITNDIKEGCSVLLRQAEALKVQFGMAMGELAKEDRIVSIEGISGREPRDVSFKNLAYIIQARMEEILEIVNWEIDNSGLADRLSAGIVVTGGGAALQGLLQLVKYKTRFDARLGYPEQLIDMDEEEEINRPELATAIGLVVEGGLSGATSYSKQGFRIRKKGAPNALRKLFQEIFSDDSNRF